MRTEQQRATSRRQRILDAALDVFSRRGYRDAAMDEIAAESGTSKGGVYFHFPSKQAIFVALLDSVTGLLRQRVEDAIARESGPVEKLDAALLTVLRTFGHHRSLSRLLLVETLGAGHEFRDKIMETHTEFARLIELHLQEAVDEGVIGSLDTRLASTAWFGALNEVVTAWLLSDAPEPLESSYPALRAFLLRSVGLDPNTTEVRTK